MRIFRGTTGLHVVEVTAPPLSDFVGQPIKSQCANIDSVRFARDRVGDEIAPAGDAV